MYFFSASEQETAKIAAHLSELIFPGDNIKLTGKMGSGKSFLCRALIKHLGYNDIVPSPTFTLINQYNNIKKNNQIITIWHADMYRLATPAEVRALGMEELLHNDKDIVLIEWADQFPSVFKHCKEIKLEIKSDTERTITASLRN